MLNGTMMKLSQDNASHEEDGQIKISEESPMTSQDDQATCHQYYRQHLGIVFKERLLHWYLTDESFSMRKTTLPNSVFYID